ncbi:DUF6437 family protein [Parvularcula oceani]|uniref:DUF6437 family protein n=1 Tax=Parvularcula oceani TaxID=1247963 RepID=UPI0004E0C4EE|nr:DUF6437 family protein [Parvularcula oceani]
MPRARDPIADLKAHQDRQADLKAKEKKLRSDAAQFLGELMMKAGLDAWPTKELQALMEGAAAAGPERALAALRSKEQLAPARGRTDPRSDTNETSEGTSPKAAAAG